MTKTSEPSQRQLRVGEEIRHILAQIFMRDEIPIDGISLSTITITEVDVSPDLRNAKAYVAPLGGGDAKALIKILNAEAGAFNKAIAKALTLKFSPRLTFSGDNRFDYAEKIEGLLKKI